MFSKHKKQSTIDLEQHEQLEYAQERIQQKKNLYRHFVWFLIGSVVLVFLNKVFKYGDEYDWSYWTIALWGFFFLVHLANVFIMNEFMGREWERQQREKLVQKQKERIAALKKEVAESIPEPQLSKKKRRLKNITMIAAVGENDALGKDNALLWHLPNDFKRFKAITTGHTIIMGRKTFESFPRPLPNRPHIIITRDRSYKTLYAECTVVHSIDEALRLVENEEQVFIIGGGEIYTQAMSVSDKLEITRVHESYEADTFFPPIDPAVWKLVKEEHHPSDRKHTVPFSYLTYTRR